MKKKKKNIFFAFSVSNKVVIFIQDYLVSDTWIYTDYEFEMTSNDIVSSDGWELSQILGSGGFGTVQLWVHAKSGKKVGKYNTKYIINL